jgi:hypothetical protein
MTCTHVLGLIDAGPFADYPRAHMDAAIRHARQCATCGPALETATILTAGLAALPQIAAPPNLAGVVLARVARSDAAESVPDAAERFALRDRSSWATTLGGLAAGLAIVLGMPAAAGVLPIPSPTVAALVLFAGLLLYVRGLFAPFGKE